MREMGIYAHPLAILAFKVEDAWGDNGAVIVWARSYPEAKRLGADGLEMEYGDGFTGDLLGWMIEDGWYFSCQECEERCYSENIVRRGDDVFCSVAHAETFAADGAEEARTRAEFQRFAEVKWFGYAPKISYVNVAGDAYCQVYVVGTREVAHGEFIRSDEIRRPSSQLVIE
jgi:hypothetical protein